MQQKINGYHLDFENHWVAELECGHAQHVRHDPPWQTREWVTTQEGRESRLGSELNCVRCDEIAEVLAPQLSDEIKKAFHQSYNEAGLLGLCQEGRVEAGLSILNVSSLKQIVAKLLKK